MDLITSYVAQLWMRQPHFQIGIALVVLWFAILLWWSSCSFCDLQHCCGVAPARFAICNIAVVLLLLVLWFAMLFWCCSCSFCNAQYCCGSRIPYKLKLPSEGGRSPLLWLMDSLQNGIAQWGWQITSASPRHHPGITSSQIRENHYVKLSSSRWVHSNGFNNFFFELSFC